MNACMPIDSIRISLDECLLLGALLQLPGVIQTFQELVPADAPASQPERFARARQTLLEKGWITVQPGPVIAIQASVAGFLQAIETADGAIQARDDQIRRLFVLESGFMEMEEVDADTYLLTMLDTVGAARGLYA